jgi:hypothetical protein
MADWELANWSNSAVVGDSPDSNAVSTEAVESPIVKIRYQGTTSMKADWEDLTCDVVIGKVWRFVMAL